MENCSLALCIPQFGSEAMEIARVGSTIDVWSLAGDAKVDLQMLLYRTLPRRIDKIGSFTPKYNTTEQLPSFTCESRTYYAFLLACPEGARKEDCWVDVTSTKKPIGAWVISRTGISGLAVITLGLYLVQPDHLRFFDQLVDYLTEAGAAFWVVQYMYSKTSY